MVFKICALSACLLWTTLCWGQESTDAGTTSKDQIFYLKGQKGDTQAVVVLPDGQKVHDPFEPVNRGIFWFNQLLDHLLLNPITHVYMDAVPDFAQNRIHSFLINLGEPWTWANQILQGKPGESCETLLRFILNSTVGLLGTFDVASSIGLERHREDLGQTLAVWGMKTGPYLVLPLFGPSSPRDALGLGTEIIMDPFNYYLRHHGQQDIVYYRGGFEIVDKKAQVVDTLESLEQNSVDYYATVRSLYLQHRYAEIMDGKVEYQVQEEDEEFVLDESEIITSPQTQKGPHHEAQDSDTNVTPSEHGMRAGPTQSI